MTDVKIIETAMGTIRMKTAGTGKPLLLVHGLFSSMESFMPLFDLLSSKRHLIALDLPDHGISTAGPTFSGGWQSYVNVIKTVADTLKLDTFDLCGHSMGGGVAAMFAGQFPERVDKLVLLDSVTARFRLPFKGRIPQIPLLGELVFKLLYREKMFHSYFRHDVFFDTSRMNMTRIRDYYIAFDRNRAAILKAMRATSNPAPVLATLKGVEAETLVIWGRRDPLIPLFVANETVRNIKRASLKIIDDCGHSPMEECPLETGALISEFFTAA